MAEKVTSMRLNEEDLEQFKAFIKDNNCSNQAEAFKSLLGMVKLENIKEKLGTRATSVEVFRDTVNKLIDFYVNSLQENETKEETIREELQKELSTKDNTISNLQEQLQKLKADKVDSDNKFKEIENNNKSLSAELQKVNTDITDKNKSIELLTKNNNTIQEQLNEFKQYKTEYKVLEKELNQLKTTNKTLETDKTTLENTVTEYQGKLQNANSINKFYIDNISELKKDIETYKADMKSLEQQHKQEIINIKADNEKSLEKDLKAIQEQLNNKNDIEVAKKDLEIQKLNNTIEQLKSKDHKPGTVKTNNNK